MAMPTLSLYHERYCQRVVRDLPGEWRPWEMDALGVLKARVSKDLARRAAAPGTAVWAQEPRFNIPGSPPSSRLVSSEGLRSFHLGVNKTAERPARSFDRYAASKTAIAAAIDDKERDREPEPASPATYDAYAIGHGGEPDEVPDHHTNLASDSDIRASQWDAIEQHERSLRVNDKPGPPRLAIYYERAPELFDRAASLPTCPDGLRALIEKEQRRVAKGKQLSERNQTLGVAWIDDAAPLAQAWLERLPQWPADANKDDRKRLTREGAGRGVQTHVSGEIEYPAAVARDPLARRNIRVGLGTWFGSQRNVGDDVTDDSILAVAIFDHAPDRLNDPRNVHCHFLAATRRMVVHDDGSLTFAENKVDAISRHGFHERLRAKFAELANIELERIDAAYRLHPGTHPEMGIHGAEAQRKLFGRAVVLERAGVPTTYGLTNDIEGWRRAFARAARRREDREAEIATMAASDAVKALLRQAALLRHQAEEIALLVAMTVSRAKRTARFAPAYAETAKRARDKSGWVARDAEARNHLAELDSELASERGTIKDRRHQAVQLERSAAATIERDAAAEQETARNRAAAHRVIDVIARIPLLISERGGRFFVDPRDDIEGHVAGVDLDAPALQRRLAGQHDAQRKALKQVQAFMNKHGHDAMFDEAKIGRSHWLRGSIEQWRSSPVMAREEAERQTRADAHRAMLMTRNRRWARDRDDLDALVAEGAITLLPGTGVHAATTVQSSPMPVSTPIAPLPVPEPALDEWRPRPPRPIPDAAVARWRAAGMDAFASDIAAFEYVLSARPDHRWITDGRLADALGADAARLTEPLIHCRLTAIWLLQETTRRDLIASRDIENYIPHPAPAEGSFHARLLADRERHAGDAVLATMFQTADDRDTARRDHRRNRLVRTTLSAIRNGEDHAVCRVLADAAIAQPNWLELRRQMSEDDLKTLWAASSMPSKAIYAYKPGHRRSRGSLPLRPGRDLR